MAVFPFEDDDDGEGDEGGSGGGGVRVITRKIGQCAINSTPILIVVVVHFLFPSPTTSSSIPSPPIISDPSPVRLTDFSPIHPYRKWGPMSSNRTIGAKSRCVRATHLARKLAAIVVTFERGARLIEVLILLQSARKCSDTVVISLHIVKSIEVMAVEHMNAEPISDTRIPEGNTTFCKPTQELKT